MALSSTQSSYYEDAKTAMRKRPSGGGAADKLGTVLSTEESLVQRACDNLWCAYTILSQLTDEMRGEVRAIYLLRQLAATTSLDTANGECAAEGARLKAVASKDLAAAKLDLKATLDAEIAAFKGTREQVAQAAALLKARQDELARIQAEADQRAALERARVALQAAEDQKARELLATRLAEQERALERERTRAEEERRVLAERLRLAEVERAQAAKALAWKERKDAVAKQLEPVFAASSRTRAMQARGIVLPKPSSPYALDRLRFGETMPFEVRHAQNMSLFLQGLFGARDALALFGGITKLRTNVDIAIVRFANSYEEYAKALKAQEESDRKRAELVGKIFAGALSLALGPLGALAGNALASVVGAAVEKLATTAMSSLVEAYAESAKRKEALDKLIEVGKGKIVAAVNEKVAKKYEARLASSRPPSSSSRDSANLSDTLRTRFQAFVDDLLKTVLQETFDLLGAPESPLVNAYLGLSPQASLARDLVDVQDKRAIDLLWQVHADTSLGTKYGDALYDQTKAYVGGLFNQSQEAIVGSFGLRDIPVLTDTEKEKLEVLFELRIWAHHLLDVFKDYKKIELKAELLNRLVTLGFVDKYSSSTTEQARSYSQGKVRYGSSHVSTNESVRVRLLLSHVDTAVDPIKVALGQKKADACEAGVHQYARNIEDALKALKSASTISSSSTEEQVFAAARAKILTLSTTAPSVSAWRDDSKVTKCHKCQTTFGLITRRHHCRLCGDIFCDACTSKRLDVSAYVKNARVCDACFAAPRV